MQITWKKVYANLLVLSQTRYIKPFELFGYNLWPLPEALFDEYMKMRKGNKSVLINKLALFAESSLEEADVELVDGNEALYHILWPKCWTVGSFAVSFSEYFKRENHDIHIILIDICQDQITRKKGSDRVQK